MTVIKILVLDRGWVLIGECLENENDVLLKNGSVIQRWGTTDGLGELAKLGKRPQTILKSFNNDVLLNKKYIIMKIDCNQDVWK